MPPIQSLSDVRKSYVQRVLRHAKGDVEVASRILGVSAEDLRRILASHGLEAPQATSSPPATLEEE